MKKYEQLIADYINGELDASGKKQVEELIASGEINFEKFREMEELYENLNLISAPDPGDKLPERFYEMLKAESEKASSKQAPAFQLQTFFSQFSIAKLTYTLVVLLIGGFVGFQINNKQVQNKEIVRLSGEVQNMQSLMIRLLQGSSATDRLKAVNISAEFSNPDAEAIQALLFTLNNDSSVNVRVQSIEALKRWGHIEKVREGLVNSITIQDSPVVIVELADAMVELGLRNSAQEFEQLLQERDLDISVKQKLENSIAVLL